MPSPYCVFGGEPIESPDGESLEGVGETRLTTGTIFTDKLFTGQREMAGLGIYHYQARFYSPKLGRFLSADTIVPSYTNPQTLNRFSYVTNNPLRYTDPTGHMQVNDGYSCHACTPTPPLSGGGGGNNNNDDDDDDVGGGGHPLSSPNLNTDYYQLTANTLYAGPILPPSPFACGWFDCLLSVGSFIASVATMTRVPQIAGPAVVADLIMTGIAVVRTNGDRSQGEITRVHQWALNGTAGLGLIPYEWGAGFSFINILVTLSGYPH